MKPFENSESEKVDWMVIYSDFNSISAMSRLKLTLFMSFLAWVTLDLVDLDLDLDLLGLDSEVSCSRIILISLKIPEDPLWLNYGSITTTEPCRTPASKKDKLLATSISPFLTIFFTHSQIPINSLPDNPRF